MPVSAAFTALLVLLAAAEQPALTPEEYLRFHGNRALPDEIYLAALNLPEGARPDEATAKLVHDQLESFLYKAGYDLANVTTVVNGELIDVELNEGRLEKIVFRGKLSLKTIRFKLLFSVPQEVFNRPLIERQLREYSQKLDIDHVWYELVPTEAVKHVGPQVENLGEIQGHELVHPLEPYELHVFFSDPEWWTGVGVDVRSGYFYGLELGPNYQGKSLLFEDDRYRVAGSAGVGLRQRISDNRIYPAFSRGAAEAIWYGPEVFVRPIVSLQGEVVELQRKDLGLENYWNAQADAAVHVQRQLARGKTVSLGFGMRYLHLWGFRAADGLEVPPFLKEVERYRTFADLGADLLFDVPSQRWDRRHELTVDVRHFFAIKDPFYGEARLFYQKVFELGWHDLFVRGRGVYLWGEVPIHYEELVAGTHLRSVFADTYVHRVASASGEFRFSITRDVYKVSFFQDVAVYGALDRATGQEDLRVGTSFGPGFNALIEGMLQLDMYLAFGFDSTGRFDSGVAVILQKVF